MATEQIMSEVITKALAKATRVAIQAMAEVQVEQMHDVAVPKKGCPALKKPTFNSDTEDKYSELKTFRLEVNNISPTYNTLQTDKLALVKTWLGRKGFQYIETLTTTEKETCITLEGLFNMLTNKFKPQYNETIKSLQFRKLCRYEDENVEEWMGRLWVAAVECNY